MCEAGVFFALSGCKGSVALLRQIRSLHQITLLQPLFQLFLIPYPIPVAVGLVEIVQIPPALLIGRLILPTLKVINPVKSS